MKRSGDSTHPCRSPTPTVNSFELISSTRTQSSNRSTETRRPVTGGRQQRTPATPTKAFNEEPGLIFLEVDKAYVDLFGILYSQDLSKIS